MNNITLNVNRHEIIDDTEINLMRNECLFPSIANELIKNVKFTANDIIKYHSTYKIEKILLQKINSNGFIFCNSGSECVIKQIIECLSKNNKQWVVPHPTFELADFYCQHYNCKVERPLYVYNNGFIINLEHIVNTRDKVLYIISPHNPTGITLSLEEIDNLCKKYKYVLLDQAYILPDEPILNLNHKNLILIRSFSKMGLITGLRFGFGICFDNNLFFKFNQIRPMYLNTFTLKYIEYIILNNITHKIKNKIDEEITKFKPYIKNNIVSSAGNFVLFNNKIDVHDGHKLKQYNFNNKFYYRMTIIESN
jgi:histidinol-phosphate/aromatic aminotransferase/cobyric acid decarboxylase-like protein